MAEELTFRFGKNRFKADPEIFINFFTQEQFKDFCKKLSRHSDQNVPTIRDLGDWFFQRQESARKACEKARDVFCAEYQDPRPLMGRQAEIARSNNTRLQEGICETTKLYDTTVRFYEILREEL